MQTTEPTTDALILIELDWEPELQCQSAHISENHLCSVVVTHVAVIKCADPYYVCQAHVDNRRANQWGSCTCGRRAKDCWHWVPLCESARPEEKK